MLEWTSNRSFEGVLMVFAEVENMAMKGKKERLCDA
jgi:hypothetical protein